jgi:hypothetical protein
MHEGEALPGDWKKAFLPIIRSSDFATAERLGGVLEIAELTSPARPRFSLGAAGKSLSVAFSAPAATTLPAHWEERVRRTMERTIEREVKFRDA